MEIKKTDIIRILNRVEDIRRRFNNELDGIAMQLNAVIPDDGRHSTLVTNWGKEIKKW